MVKIRRCWCCCLRGGRSVHAQKLSFWRGEGLGHFKREASAGTADSIQSADYGAPKQGRDAKGGARQQPPAWVGGDAASRPPPGA